MISVYRKISGVETEICTLSAKQSEHKTAIRGLNEIQISITVDVMLPILEGDYIKLNGVNYTINRDVEYTIESDVKYSYDFVFEHPFYILLNKLYCNRITGHTSFTLTGKLLDFVELLVWCVNISPENPDGVDTGWTVGEIFNTEYKTLTFQDMYCNEVLNKLSDEFQVEYFFNNKQVNFVERIERLTDHVFEHGAGKGLYKLTQQNVDKEDTVTRLLVRGGNQNVPNGYADEEGYLKLPENYLEDFSEHAKVVERKKKFEEEFPRFVGSIATVSGENNKILTCPQIDFDIAAIAVGDNARINFLTGDLMGVSMKFNWQNSNKQITLIEQEDETALAGADGTKPTIPNTSKKAKVGDEFNFTGVLMPESYVTASITRLRNKGNKYLGLFSKKRVKFTLDIDHRYMRGKPELIVGDLVVISIPQRNFNQVIRITELGKNLHTGAISATVSNYLEENWEKYVESKVENVRNDILAKQANVRNTLETIFRDGIVTESELKSIEAILTNLSVERGQLNAQYLVVRGNVNLINKTPLETAWSNYQTAFVDVETAINNAITDKLISDAEKANIDNKISVYSTRLNELSAALENARDSIENYKNQGVLDVVDQNKQYLQDQIDGVVDNWFYPYSPTLANYPASDWTTNAIKDRHIGDTFTNTQQAPATDAGKSWRFVKNGTVYSWTQIADSDAVLALQKAAQAQSTADGKSTTYLIQPTSYKLGDMWVLSADQTVNGVAYKSGEILTATQDSTTYNQAHWVKKVRYTDDSAVNNIRGGVNLLLQSDRYDKTSITSNDSSQYPISKTNMDEGSRKFVRIKRTNTTLSPTIISLYNIIPLTALSQSVVGKEITISFDARVNLATTSTLFAVEYTPAKSLSDHGKTINLTTEWTRYYTTFVVSSDLTGGFRFCPFTIQIAGDINDFYLDISRFAVKFGNIKDEWDVAPEDVQVAIDAAVVKATYWSVKASAPVIYKDAINAATSGTHTPVTVSGELRSGTTTTSGGFITVTPNGGTEAGTASASPVTIAPANGDGKTSYTVKLYDTASKTTLLDTMTIPVVFKGASGINAINVVLSNEADVLPASPEGVVSDYTGSGTIIRVFEGATELDYDGIGTANGKFNVTASATGITAGAKSESGLTCVFANASNMTADNATITFTIIGKTSAGASFSLIKTQTFAKSRTGQKGDKGDQGLQGIQGTPGSDGITYYTWVRYADTPTTGMSQYPTGKSYIGFAYNKTTATESSNYADYKWSLIKGEQGIPGEKGADGTQYYTWIKYADTPTSGMSDSPTGKAYIGIAVNKTTATESTNYADYTWQLTKGEKGEAGVSITDVDVEFAKNTNATTPPAQGDAGWSTTAPTLTGTEQLWTRTKTTYSAGNPTYSTPANITPKKGDTGAVGQGVDSVTEEYAISTSKTTQPTTGWSTTPPTWENGKYIWSRVKVVYKNPAQTIYTGYAVSSEWEAVNNVQIGGRNLIAKKYIKDWNLVSSSIVVQGSDDDGDYLGVNQTILYTTVGGGTAYNDIFQGKIHYNEYTQYALKVRWKMAGTQVYPGLMLRFKYSDGTYSEYISLNGSNTTLTEKSIISEVGKTVSGISCVYGDGANRSLIYDIQMTEGNKHTAGYSVAPEDVQAAIDAEKTRINDILSDNIADPSEKQYLSNLWREIYAEYPRIWAQANDYSVDKSNYEAKYTALNNLLSPVLANLTTNSTVSGASIRTAFSQYYDAKTFLLNNITNKVNQNAGDAAAVAADAQAKANTAKAVTDKFGTQIGGVGFDSALISTVLILLRELNSQQDTAGISGIQGAQRNLPAFWTGGTYADALSGAAGIIFRHNSTGKIGVLDVDANGNVKIMDTIDPLLERLLFSKFDIPTVESLRSSSSQSGSADNAPVVRNTTGLSIMPNTTTVSSNGSRLTISGTLYLAASLEAGQTAGSASVYLMLYKNDEFYASIRFLNYSLSTNSGPVIDSVPISTQLTVEAGVYSLQVYTEFVNTTTTSEAGTSGTTSMTWSFSDTIKRFEYGTNGFMGWYTNNHIHFTETGGLDVRGATNMPGAMAKGRVLSGAARDANYAWGAKYSAAGVTKISTGGYRVPVSCPDAYYSVLISPRAASRSYYLGTQTSTYFEVYFTNLSGAAVDTEFDFTVVGKNY